MDPPKYPRHCSSFRWNTFVQLSWKTQRTTPSPPSWNWHPFTSFTPSIPSTHLVFRHPYWSTPQMHRAQVSALANSLLSDLSSQWYPTCSDYLSPGWNASAFEWSCSGILPLAIPMACHVVFLIPTACLPEGNTPWTQSNWHWGLEKQIHHFILPLIEITLTPHHLLPYPQLPAN